ncbi:MAG: hypothetical protein L6284_13385, partial [Brevundimonas sp.]|nr:hypothetical protein [Brevundimonas sp.]
MTSAPITASSPAAWLKQTAAPWRRLTILAGLLVVADVAPAVGFAGGLAMTVATFGSSPLAALPWLLLAVFSLMARGLIGQAAVVVGARLGRSIKTDVRDRLLADLFGRGGRAADPQTAGVEGVGARDGDVSRLPPLGPPPGRLLPRRDPRPIAAPRAAARDPGGPRGGGAAAASEQVG